MELELEPLNFPSDQERPCVIAGPCSAETEEQVMSTAKQLLPKVATCSAQVCGSHAPNREASRVTVKQPCLG